MICFCLGAGLDLHCPLMFRFRSRSWYILVYGLFLKTFLPNCRNALSNESALTGCTCSSGFPLGTRIRGLSKFVCGMSCLPIRSRFVCGMDECDVSRTYIATPTNLLGKSLLISCYDAFTDSLTAPVLLQLRLTDLGPKDLIHFVLIGNNYRCNYVCQLR